MKRALVLKVQPKNGGREGNSQIISDQIFGDYNTLTPEFQVKVKSFLSEVNNRDFIRVPEELMDTTSKQNFKYYVIGM